MQNLCINNRTKINTAKHRRDITGSGEFVYHGHPETAFSTFCSNSSASGPTGSATFIYCAQTTLNRVLSVNNAEFATIYKGVKLNLMRAICHHMKV